MSIVNYLFNVISISNLGKEVSNMVVRSHTFEKAMWKKIVSENAWALEDIFWKIEHKIQKSLDMIIVVNPSPSCLTWWALLDKYSTTIYLSETMARLVCHASLLRTDVITLKKLPPFARTCPLCNMASSDDAKHLIYQCPSSENRQSKW